MCSIAGILYLAGDGQAQRELLEEMTAVQEHRGPDGRGYYIDPVSGACGLGHSRLAVIDLAGGNQPLANEDQTLWVSYNGEIYNSVSCGRNWKARGINSLRLAIQR